MQRTLCASFFPYTTLFRSPHVILTGVQRVRIVGRSTSLRQGGEQDEAGDTIRMISRELDAGRSCSPPWRRSEEHTSELQSRVDIVCRLLLEKKNAQRWRAS